MRQPHEERQEASSGDEDVQTERKIEETAARAATQELGKEAAEEGG